MEPNPIPGRAQETANVGDKAAAALERNKKRVAVAGKDAEGKPSSESNPTGHGESNRSGVLTFPA